MEETPNNHLGCTKPCKQWDILHINWCRISLKKTLWGDKIWPNFPGGKKQLAVKKLHLKKMSLLWQKKYHQRSEAFPWQFCWWPFSWMVKWSFLRFQVTSNDTGITKKVTFLESPGGYLPKDPNHQFITCLNIDSWFTFSKHLSKKWGKSLDENLDPFLSQQPGNSLWPFWDG